eukprot:UN29438
MPSEVFGNSYCVDEAKVECIDNELYLNEACDDDCLYCHEGYREKLAIEGLGICDGDMYVTCSVENHIEVHYESRYCAPERDYSEDEDLCPISLFENMEDAPENCYYLDDHCCWDEDYCCGGETVCAGSSDDSGCGYRFECCEENEEDEDNFPIQITAPYCDNGMRISC